MGSYGTVPDVAVDVAEEEAPLEWWRVACEVESVRGCAIHHSLQDVLHAASTLRVGVRAIVNGGKPGPELRGARVEKNASTLGADWTVARAAKAHPETLVDVPAAIAEQRATLALRVEARSTDAVALRCAVYERTTRDVGDPHENGVADRGLSLPGERTRLVLPLAYNGKQPNGEVALWVTVTRERAARAGCGGASWRRNFACGLAAACGLFAAAWGLPAALVLAALVGLPWLALEGPTLLGAALGLILKLAAPGLGFEAGAVGVGLSVYKELRSGDRHLFVRASVADFKLRHDAGAKFSHESFVTADAVRLELSVDVARVAAELARRAKLARARNPKTPTHAVLSLACDHVAAVDGYFFSAAKGWSNPYCKVVVAPPSAGGDDLSPEHVDACACVAVTEVRAGDLNPRFQPLSVPVDALRAKLGDGGRCFVVVLDHETLAKDRVIGVARVDFPLSDAIKTCDAVVGRLTRKGEDAGGVSLGVEYVSAHGVSVLPWSPFPSVHDALRVGDAPRLGTVVVHHFSVDGACVAFDAGEAHGEFNVNNFVRGLAEGKVRSALGARAAMPTTVRVRAFALALPRTCAATHVTATFTIRREAAATATAAVVDGAATFDGAALELHCADPSAVLRVVVADERKRVVGQWVVTLKMLVVAPRNVFGAVEHAELLPPGRYASKTGARVRGAMALRSRDFLLARDPPTLDLEVAWVADERAPSHFDHVSRLTSLEQLQEGSDETNLKLGNLKLVAHMLADFPLLFDVRHFVVNDVNFYLRALFMGHSSDHSHRGVHIQQLDLRDKLKAGPHEDGVPLLTLAVHLVKDLAGPVLAEVSIVDGARQILSGVAAGLRSRAPAAAPAARAAPESAVHAAEHLADKPKTVMRDIRKSVAKATGAHGFFSHGGHSPGGPKDDDAPAPAPSSATGTSPTWSPF